MKRILILFALCIGVVAFTDAQSLSNAAKQENVRDLAASDNTLTIQTFDNRYEGIKGHPYIYEDWLMGQLITTAGYRYKDVKLKYNIHKDEVSLQRKNTAEVVVLYNEQVVSFTIAGTPFKTVKDPESTKFYEILASGSHSLLVKRKKQFLKADFEGAYSAGRTSDEFVEAPAEYFIQQSDKLPVKIKLNAKSLAQAYGANEKEVKAYVKSQDLDLKFEKDLIKLALFLNQ